MATRKVGFMGLGAMGNGMAFNLQNHLKSTGANLTVWNRTLAKAAELESRGANVQKEGGPKALAKDCSLIFSMLFDDQALRETSRLVCESGNKNLTWVDCSTVYPETMKEVASAVKASGIKFAACPMFGRPDAALGVLAGPEDVKKDVRPYIEAMTRAIMDLGTEPHLASTQKLIGNFMIASTIEVLAEAQNLAVKTGLSRQSFMEFIDHVFPNPIIQGYANRMCNDQFEITPEAQGFSLQGGMKDVGMIQKLAKENGAKTPVADLAYAHLEKQRADGKADLDWGVLALSVREEFGK
ncbi:hypothetical protein DFS34DRAFT_645715 [Phlyctochytrium arcticum]|nr:hypothetical protein DFS34DRAFT_645715 [Phlyctochytrium arcticum]